MESPLMQKSRAYPFHHGDPGSLAYHPHHAMHPSTTGQMMMMTGYNNSPSCRYGPTGTPSGYGPPPSTVFNGNSASGAPLDSDQCFYPSPSQLMAESMRPGGSHRSSTEKSALLGYPSQNPTPAPNTDTSFPVPQQHPTAEMPCSTLTSTTTSGTNPTLPTTSNTSWTGHSLEQTNSKSPFTEAPSCAACGLRIEDKIVLKALERYWHSTCLKCSSCQAILDQVGPSCFTRGNMILCRKDYTKMFGSRGTCASCEEEIAPDELVMRCQSREQSLVFHPACFLCAQCQQPLRPGDHYCLHLGRPYCHSHFHNLTQTSASNVTRNAVSTAIATSTSTTTSRGSQSGSSRNQIQHSQNNHNNNNNNNIGANVKQLQNVAASFL